MISASSAHYQRIISTSSVHQQCIISASSAYRHIHWNIDKSITNTHFSIMVKHGQMCQKWLSEMVKHGQKRANWLKIAKNGRISQKWTQFSNISAWVTQPEPKSRGPKGLHLKVGARRAEGPHTSSQSYIIWS